MPEEKLSLDQICDLVVQMRALELVIAHALNAYTWEDCVQSLMALDCQTKLSRILITLIIARMNGIKQHEQT